MSITKLNRIMNQLLSSLEGKQENCIQQNVYDLYNYILDPEFDQFLLQLCFLFYVTDNKKLKELLFNYAQKNNSNYYRMVWTLKALNEDSKYQKVNKILEYEQISNQMKNSFRNNTFKQATIIIIQKNRENYSVKQDQIMFNLIEQSLRLKKIEIREQKAHMVKFLQSIKLTINNLRYYDQPELRGLTIPFNNGNQDSYLIVNLLVDEFTCFNTAKRVPYKIIVETVNPSELQLIQNVNELQNINMPELIPIYDIEKEMKTISQIKIYSQYNTQELKKLTQYKTDFQRSNIFQSQIKIKEKDVFVNRRENKQIWGEDWNITKQKIKQNSQYGNLKSYDVRQIIIKGGDDLRNELLIMQMIKKIHEIFQQKQLKLFLRPYDIILTSANSGILEYIPNTVSLDKIKKENQFISLKQFYLNNFENFQEAQKNFAESLAGYSLICYLFQLKDRHNGNILIDNEGHIIHIDFGFVLTLSPGNIGFESAPFKLTQEYEELLGGKGNDIFIYFKVLLFSGLAILQENTTELLTYLKLMHFSPKHNLLACLENFNLIEFQKRFHEHMEQQALYDIVYNLVEQSSNSWKTNLYDYFQFKTNAIHY